MTMAWGGGGGDTSGQRLVVQQTASRVLLEATTLEEAMAEILRAVSVHLDWPLAVYWVAETPAEGPTLRRLRHGESPSFGVDAGEEGPAQGPALRCRAIWAADAILRQDVVETSRVSLLHPGQDPAGQALAKGEAVWIERLPADPGSHRLRQAVAAELVSVAAFPIRDRSTVAAAIELFASEPRPIDEEMLQLMAGIGHQICQVLRHLEVQAAALAALERSRDELGVVLGALPDGITVQDGGGRFLYANEAAARAAGFGSSGEMIQASLAEILRRYRMWDENGRLLHEQDLPQRAALEGKRKERLLRYRSVDASGGDRWISMEAIPLTDGRGRVERVVNIIHDVTEQRRGHEWQRFLGDASTALGSSMELEAVLQAVAELAVRSVADCCSVALTPRGGRSGSSPSRGRARRRRRAIPRPCAPSRGPAPPGWWPVAANRCW